MTQETLKPQLLSVVVPAYNEVESLKWVVEELVYALNSLVEKWEVLIVDDGSSDGTGDLADLLAKDLPGVSALHHEKNQGHGQALITGFHSCKGDWLTSIPGDGQIDPKDFETFLGQIQEADFITSFYLDRDDGLDRTLLSRGFRGILYLFFGKIPRSEGPRFFKKEVFEAVTLESATFMANLEIVIRAHRAGFRFQEVPVHCRQRVAGETKAATPTTIMKVLWELFQLRFFYLTPLSHLFRSKGPKG